VKVLKLAWDATGSDFGSRHELYERNYAGNHEQVQVDQYLGATATGLADKMVGFVDDFMSEYDTKGWTVPDLIDPRTDA
jgi:4-hydroxyphenylacetate 3-monooxygenase